MHRLGTGRSGSTLLVDMLNHPAQISCDRETLNRHDLKRKPLQNLLRQSVPRLLITLHRVKSLAGSRKRIFGFKLQAPQVLEPPRLLRRLQYDG